MDHSKTNRSLGKFCSASFVSGILCIVSVPVWAQADRPQSPTDAERAAVAALVKKQVSMTIDGEYHVVAASNTSRTNPLGEQLTDEDLVHLKSLSSLESLFFRGTGITNAALPHLKELTNVQTMWLGGTSITSEGIAELQKALPNCRISGPRGGGFSGATGGVAGGGFPSGFDGRTNRMTLIGQLVRDDVQAELQLKREQRSKVEALIHAPAATDSTAYRTLLEQYQQVQDRQQRDALREKLTAAFAELRSQTTAVQDQQVVDILTPEQLDRLKQLRWQANRIFVLGANDFQAAMNLSDEQKAQVQELFRQRTAALQARFGRDRDATNQTPVEDWDAKLLAVLNDEQRQLRDKLLGAPLAVTSLQVGEYTFGLLDTNADGSLTNEEWQESSGVRSSFARHNLELKLPATKDEFAKVYEQSRAAARRGTTRSDPPPTR